jgi:hypothetical protein
VEATNVSEQLINWPRLNMSSSLTKYMLTIWLFSNKVTTKTAKTWLFYDSCNVMITTPYRQVNHYQCSGRTCCFRLQVKDQNLNPDISCAVFSSLGTNKNKTPYSYTKIVMHNIWQPDERVQQVSHRRKKPYIHEVNEDQDPHQEDNDLWVIM